MMQLPGSFTVQSAFSATARSVTTAARMAGGLAGFALLLVAIQFSASAVAADNSSSTDSRSAETQADATVGAEEMRALLKLARATDRNVMVVFGADWCDRCVLLNRYMSESELQQRIAERFVVMHVDVGYWDKHRQYEAQMGHPTREGLPAVVIADAEEDYSNIMQSEELVTFLPDRDQPIYDWMDRVLSYAEQTYAIR